MSGICGVWALDGGEPHLEQVLAMLERRGPDGTQYWRDGSVALGHTLLATTPEALVEVLPLTEPDSGCTITADARIDNRKELIAALGLEVEVRVIGDGELILHAYLKWGEDCPAHLLGDFAFAIWDSRVARLFCARDQMGMRQFNYCHIPGKLFAFATEDTALLAHGSVPKGLNENRVADFIADLEGYDFTSTFFDSIHRLQPAHGLTIDPDQCAIRRYWTLRPGPPLLLDSDQAFAEAFLKVFTQAVRCRLRGTGRSAAMLSGGLDSSAVVAVAGGILSATGAGPLRTISAVGPDGADCAETRAIRSALTIEGLSPLLVGVGDVHDMSAELIAAMTEVRNPFETHGTMLRSIYSTARRNRINVVLDGGSGDVILTADNRVAALLSAGRFGLAVRELRGQRSFWRPSKPINFMARGFMAAAWVAFAPLKLRATWRRVRLSKALDGLQPQFADRVGFAERRRTADRHVRMTVAGDSPRRAQSIVHPNLASGRERYEQLAATFGVESRDPFMDIRVIAFCLSLPPEQLTTDGWPKIILRRAVAGLVPQDIAWRRGKEHLGWTFTTTLLASWGNWRESMRDPDTPLVRYLSERSLSDLRKVPDEPPNGLNLRLMALDRFLRRYAIEPDRH